MYDNVIHGIHLFLFVVCNYFTSALDMNFLMRATESQETDFFAFVFDAFETGSRVN